MLVESLVIETAGLQGFRVATVRKSGDDLVAVLTPYEGVARRFGAGGHRAVYRDTRSECHSAIYHDWGLEHLWSMRRAVLCAGAASVFMWRPRPEFPEFPVVPIDACPDRDSG